MHRAVRAQQEQRNDCRYALGSLRVSGSARPRRRWPRLPWAAISARLTEGLVGRLAHNIAARPETTRAGTDAFARALQGDLRDLPERCVHFGVECAA